MSRTAMNKASGTDFVPDLEDWWGDFDENIPPPRIGKPRLRVIENPRYAQNSAPTKKIGARKLKRRQLEMLVGRALMILTALVLVVGLFMQITRLADISGQSKRISQLNDEIRSLKENGQNLQVRLSMQQNIERVRNEAVNRLGMVYPEGDAVRIVDLPGVYTDTEAKTAELTGGEEGIQ